MAVRILGIDPGSRITGYGIIDAEGQRMRFVDCGVIRARSDHMPERLGIIFQGIRELIAGRNPGEMAIEQVFVNRNVDSALKLGQARGAAICAGVNAGLDVAEYTPRAVKKAIVGTGGADKVQVQHMVSALLELPRKPQADAADALAMAICHAHHVAAVVRIPQVSRARGGRWRCSVFCAVV